MDNSKIEIKTGKDIIASEITMLRRSVNWDRQASCAEIERAMESYPYIAQARNSSGELVGYVAAFSDGVFITMIGELLVHPGYQRQGIGSALLRQVEQRYPGIPIEVKCPGEQVAFFVRRGYLSRGKGMQLVSKVSAPLNESVITWAVV